MKTEREYRELCIEMWELLVQHPSWDKEDAINEMNKGDPAYNCWACQYVMDKVGETKYYTDCAKYCPVKWGFGESKIHCLNRLSQYKQWRLYGGKASRVLEAIKNTWVIKEK